ncbi:MAG: TIGR04282 family arsenosugar biosynthesis glycosyltransferase, partial [Desulfatitalea sp.]|nr:TIGR04282 family arsenosugar biosynthesis glycosyltransferase [Desulfatitalea sp.]
MPGRTKTRLIPALGALGAAELQRWLTEKTLATLGHASLGGIDFCFEGGSHAQVHRWLGHRHGVAHIYPQADGDLGRRMAAALDQALACGVRQVVLLGTDVPGLTADHLRRAFDALGHNDVGFGPSTDGGYWLVGCRRPAAVFADIHWGSDCVLDQTLMAARRQGLSTALL